MITASGNKNQQQHVSVPEADKRELVVLMESKYN